MEQYEIVRYFKGKKSNKVGGYMTKEKAEQLAANMTKAVLSISPLIKFKAEKVN